MHSQSPLIGDVNLREHACGAVSHVNRANVILTSVGIAVAATLAINVTCRLAFGIGSPQLLGVSMAMGIVFAVGFIWWQLRMPWAILTSGDDAASNRPCARHELTKSRAAAVTLRRSKYERRVEGSTSLRGQAIVIAVQMLGDGEEIVVYRIIKRRLRLPDVREAVKWATTLSDLLNAPLNSYLATEAMERIVESRVTGLEW